MTILSGGSQGVVPVGFDVTFHPIGKDELKEFVFDIIENPQLAKERAAKVTRNREKQEDLLSLYEYFAEWKEQVQSGEELFSRTFAFAAAVVAGYLHPYWYARDGSVTFLCEGQQSFCAFLESLYDLSPATFGGLPDDGKGLIPTNYAGGGFIDHTKLKDLQNRLSDPRNQDIVLDALAKDGLSALQHAITYALANGVGLLEATDVVVPVSDECVSDFDNFRADFMGTDKEYRNSRQR